MREKVGLPKRDLMIKRIGQQQTAATVPVCAVRPGIGCKLRWRQPGNYDKLNAEYEDSVSAAETVNSRIDSIKSVADALFDEWQEEL